jgi:hypothetical protein
MSGPALPANENRAFLALFLVAALWNLAGAIPGVIDPAGMFAPSWSSATVACGCGRAAKSW